MLCWLKSGQNNVNYNSEKLKDWCENHLEIADEK